MSAWHQLVNVPAPARETAAPAAAPAPGAPPAASTASTATISAFITPQALVTFPVASLVVKFCWSAAGTLLPEVGKHNLVGFAIAVGVGFLIYSISTNDSDLAATQKEKRIGAVIAFINAIFLFAAAAGLDQTVSKTDAVAQKQGSAATGTASAADTAAPTSTSQPPNNSGAPQTNPAPAPTPPSR